MPEGISRLLRSKKPKINDFYEVLENVAWIWRISGVFPMSIKNLNGNKRYRINKFFALYSFFMFAICISYIIYAMNEFLEIVSRNSPLTWATFVIRVFAAILCMISTHVWRIFQLNELSQSIAKISEQEMIMERMLNCRFNYETHGRIIRVYVITTLIFIVLFVCYDFYITPLRINHYSVEWLFCTIPPCAHVMDLTIFVSIVGWLGFKFRAINEKIQIIATRANSLSPEAISSVFIIKTSNVCADNLRVLSKIHYNICAIGKQINKIFYWSVIVNVPTTFIVVSMTFYYIFYELQKGQTNATRLVSHIHCEIIYSVPIIIIVIVCNWTSGQEIKTRKLIHEIRVRDKDSRLYEIVKSFSLQLHHQKIGFTAGGFFPLNSTLLQAMIANITTYLVILIQFEPKLHDA